MRNIPFMPIAFLEKCALLYFSHSLQRLLHNKGGQDFELPRDHWLPNNEINQLIPG